MPFRGYGVAGYVVLLIIAWMMRKTLFLAIAGHTLIILAICGGLFLFILILPVVEFAHSRELRRSWRHRLEKKEGFPHSKAWINSIFSLVLLLNHALDPLFRSGVRAVVLGWWRDGGFGSGPLPLVLTYILSVGGGFLCGFFLTHRLLLSVFIAFLFLIGLSVLLYSRARMQRKLFQEQFPGILERLSDSLQAGFSLPQAIEFIIPNLSQPGSKEMAQISTQIKLGFTVDQALRGLYKRHPTEDVRLLVEGLTLQRQVGGNMAAMMRDMAEVVRARVELENEIRTMTAQGRLSAVVIALLVPVSLGLLSMFPGYTDVLFNTTIGNFVLITVGVLELIGAAIVAHLIRIEV